jgi:hypothetical protein
MPYRFDQCYLFILSTISGRDANHVLDLTEKVSPF